MNEFDDEEIFERIPYDQVPISRGQVQRQTPALSQKHGAGGMSKLWAVLLSVMVLMNVLLGGVVIKLFQEVQKPTNVYNMDVSIDSAAASDVLNAVTKAKFSAVCVNVGSSSVSSLNAFYNLTSRGSGVIIDIDKEAGNAYILTCFHVLQTAKYSQNVYPYIYILPFGGYYPIQAELVNFSYVNDIALLKVSNNAYLRSSLATACEMADSSLVVEGETAFAIGNALNTGISVTTGIISSPANIIKVDSNSAMRCIKVDTAINAGNSGGGLFDINGKLIGIVNAKLMSSEIDNVGYAIPSNMADSIAKSILHYGTSASPAMAVVGLTLTSNEAMINAATGGLKETVYIESISSPASASGLAVGDVINSFTFGETTISVTTVYDLDDHLFEIYVGDTIVFNVTRNGVVRQFSVTVRRSTTS